MLRLGMGSSSFSSPLSGEVRDRLATGETATHFVVEGRHAVTAALGSDFGIEAVVVVKRGEGTGSESIADAARAKGVPVFAIEPVEAESLLGFAFHRGVLAVARKPEREFASSVAATDPKPRRVVFLENLADPGNVGTVIRNAAAFGFEAVLVTEGGASPFNAKAVRASATAIFSLPVFAVSGLAEAKNALPETTWIGTALAPDSESLRGFSTVEISSLAIVLGSEADGLSAETLAGCDRLVRIPISDRVESLNVASASAILLHAWGAVS